MTVESGFSHRVGEFGLLGRYLHDDILVPRPHVTKRFMSLGLVDKLVALHGSVSTLAGEDILLPLAITLLVSDYPMQMDINNHTLLTILRRSFDYSFVTVRHDFPSFNLFSHSHAYYRKLGRLAANNDSFRKTHYPMKRHAAAGIKQNVRLGPLVRSLAKHYGLAKLGSMLCLMPPGTPSDVMCCFLLYAVSLQAHFGAFGVQIAAAQLIQLDNAKGLSNVLKATGANTSFPGCLLVEAQAMQGRSSAPVDLDKEIWKRTTPDGVRTSVIPHSVEFEAHIAAVLDMELGDCQLPDMDDWWSSRWLWCVNGAQNRESDSLLGLSQVPRDLLGSQRFRRMASEETAVNPVPTWDGNTHVSFSEKLECGKTRAIFACDTVSYFAFSYVLGAVQRSWRNQRVLLDPGRGGYSAIARRILRGSGYGGVNLMLDYDDFNSHHSTETMKALFRILCDRLRAPRWYRDVIVSSFDKMHITRDGTQLKILGTLMSGHRGTTFINSVLNAAYIRAALGGSRFDNMLTLHTGDDVYMRASTFAECGEVLQKTKDFGCRMNPAKQSIGFYRAEFLRMGINRQYAVGYLCRQLATTVSGNWGSTADPEPADMVQSLVASSWGLINRGFPRSLAFLFSESMPVFRFVKQRLARSLLSGEVALGGGPVVSSDYKIRNTEIRRPTQPRVGVGVDWQRNATRAYLAQHLSPVEVEAINRSSVNISDILVSSSYSKGLNQRDLGVNRTLSFKPIQVKQVRGTIDLPTLLARQQDRGVLSQYPVLQLIKNSIDDETLYDLLTMVGADTTARDLKEVAFGRESTSCCICGILPYSDASTYAKRTTCDSILVTYNIHL